MKHLKLFETTQEKETWKNSDNYIIPNVIYVNENDVIEYNSNVQLLSLQTFTAYPEVANKIMNIVNKYCSNYENANANYMTIFIDMNANYNGTNYVSGYATISFVDSDEHADLNLSTEDLNYLQSISIVDTDGNVYKPHIMNMSSSIDFVISNIDFVILEDNTDITSNTIRRFYMRSGYITDPEHADPNAPQPE